MLSPIAKEVSIPENLAIGDGKLTHAVRPTMQKTGTRAIEDLPMMSPQAAAEIYVFKPHRKKTFIKTANVCPSLVSHGQTGAGRLINLLCLGIV
jgi:hypothetical protein